MNSNVVSNIYSNRTDFNYCNSYAELCNTKTSTVSYKELLNAKNSEIETLEIEIMELKLKIKNASQANIKIPTITDIKVPQPGKVVIVEFSDGTKEKAVCDAEDPFTLETGIQICVMKKMMGGSAAYNKYMENAVNFYNEKVEKEAAEKAERERVARKREKEIERKKRRRERKIAEQIRIQKEAYLQALREYNN